MKGNCKCFHHGFVKILVTLAWLSAIGFWWSSVFKQTFLWMDSSHFFMDVIVLGVLVFVSKYCGCCGMGVSNNTCSHDQGCSCGDCGMCK